MEDKTGLQLPFNGCERGQRTKKERKNHHVIAFPAVQQYLNYSSLDAVGSHILFHPTEQRQDLLPHS